MIYLDNSATTKPCQEAIDAIDIALSENWANPQSTHFAGNSANRLLEESRINILNSIGIKHKNDGKLIFTSSGTEANNLAIMGVVNSKHRPQKGKIIISNGEHPSVENTAKQLEADGYTIIRVPTINGVLDLDFLNKNVDSTVIMASIMLVNNETGALYDVKAASEIMKRICPKAVMHVDCVQAYGKIKFSPTSLKADMITISSHKICGPKGVGALYVSQDIIKEKKIVPIIFGGDQEESRRPGTENLPGIAGFGAAAKACYENLDKNIETLHDVHSFGIETLSKIDGVRLNIPREKYSSSVISITLPSIKSETMLNYLSAKDICVSAGSACSARSAHKSLALSAFGLTDKELDSTIRVSLNHTNTKEDIIALDNALREGISSLQRIKR